jgi:hypothetical protein
MGNIGQYVGLGVGLEEAVEIRNILIFRYMWVFFGISFGLSIVRSGSGPARYAGDPIRPVFSVAKTRPGPARPVPRAVRSVQTSNQDHRVGIALDDGIFA